MSRPEEPFDAAHSRCVYPAFGQHFSDVLAATGKRPVEIAKAVNISPEIVRGYRRGFARPSPQTQARLEKFLGVSLNLQDVPNMLQTISLPGTMTVQRDPSGDLMLSFRVSPTELAGFLAA